MKPMVFYVYAELSVISICCESTLPSSPAENYKGLFSLVLCSSLMVKMWQVQLAAVPL